MITVFGALGMMLSISPPLVLVFTVTVPASLLFTRYKSRKVRPLFKTRSAKLGALNGYAEEMLSGQKTIRAYSREDIILSRFDERNTDAAEAYYRADYHGSVIGPTMIFINNLSLTLITALGGLFYLLTKTVPTLPLIFVIDPYLYLFQIMLRRILRILHYVVDFHCCLSNISCFADTKSFVSQGL
jgi:ABC-type multidrug transport system fused ATPase/permease subunit